MARVIVTITPSGETIVKVEGVQGTSCEALTKSLQAAIGRTVRDVKTAEYSATAETEKRRVSA